MAEPLAEDALVPLLRSCAYDMAHVTESDIAVLAYRLAHSPLRLAAPPSDPAARQVSGEDFAVALWKVIDDHDCTVDGKHVVEALANIGASLSPPSDPAAPLREALALLNDALNVQRFPCDHRGIGKPGCATCDPRVYAKALTALATPAPPSVRDVLDTARCSICEDPS